MKTPLEAACDAMLIDSLSAGVRLGIEAAITLGGTVAACVAAARRGGAGKLTCAAVEACAEAALARRQANPKGGR